MGVHREVCSPIFRSNRVIWVTLSATVSDPSKILRVRGISKDFKDNTYFCANFKLINIYPESLVLIRASETILLLKIINL